MASLFLLGAHPLSLSQFRGHLIADLVAKGHRVFACAPNLEGDLAQAVVDLGGEPLSLTMDRHGLGPLSNLRYAARLEALMRKIRPDTFLGYTAKPVVWGAPAARAAGVRRVAALITGLGYAFIDGKEFKRRFVRLALSQLYRRALARCDEVIFQNPDDRDTFVRLGLLARGRDAHVVNGSGVDLSHYHSVPVPTTPRFLMIARLLKDKGVREYAAASASLKARYPQASFQLAGWLDSSPDSVSADELAGWVAGGLEYLGHIDDVRPALAAASCYVLPSYREGTPRTVLEALATGRAVVTTDVPGCRETVIAGQNGYLVPARNAQALAGAMERLIVDPGLAVSLGAASLRLAAEKYEVHAVNRQMIDILRLPAAG